MIARVLTGLLLTLGTVAVEAQAAAQGQAPGVPSSYVQPALEELRQTLSTVQLGKWKGANAAKDEVDANLTSIRRDLDGTLPGLLQVADAAPASVAGTLPVTRNLGALYDVLLRIVERGKGVAPPEQLAALERARVDLDAARRALEDRLQAMATALEARAVSLQKDLEARPAVAPAPPAPAAAPKKKSKKKAASGS